MRKGLLVVGVLVVSMFTGNVIMAQQTGASAPGAAAGYQEAAQLDAHFYRADLQMQNRENRAAADEIRKAADLVEQAATGERGRAEHSAREQVKRLEKLADQLEQGNTTERRMRDTFAAVHHEMAKQQHQEADRLWRERKAQEAGQKLHAAMQSLDNAAKWSGEEVAAGSSRVWHATRETAGLAVRGVGFVPEEVGKGIKFVGDEVEKLGRKIQGRKRG